LRRINSIKTGFIKKIRQASRGKMNGICVVETKAAVVIETEERFANLPNSNTSR